MHLQIEGVSTTEKELGSSSLQFKGIYRKTINLEFHIFDKNLKVMDLQTRKMEFIQEFLKVESEEVISRLETLLKQEKQTIDQDVQPMTEAEFNQRIDKSLEDSINGNLTEGNELLSQIAKWS